MRRAVTKEEAERITTTKFRIYASNLLAINKRASLSGCINVEEDRNYEMFKVPVNARIRSKGV